MAMYPNDPRLSLQAQQSGWGAWGMQPTNAYSYANQWAQPAQSGYWPGYGQQWAATNAGYPGYGVANTDTYAAQAMAQPNSLIQGAAPALLQQPIADMPVEAGPAKGKGKKAKKQGFIRRHPLMTLALAAIALFGIGKLIGMARKNSKADKHEKSQTSVKGLDDALPADSLQSDGEHGAKGACVSPAAASPASDLHDPHAASGGGHGASSEGDADPIVDEETHPFPSAGAAIKGAGGTAAGSIRADEDDADDGSGLPCDHLSKKAGVSEDT